jgi:hypothetical protein
MGNEWIFSMVKTPKEDLTALKNLGHRLFLFSVMTAFIFWTLLYRLGSEVADLPNFVYVNF